VLTGAALAGCSHSAKVNTAANVTTLPTSSAATPTITPTVRPSSPGTPTESSSPTTSTSPSSPPPSPTLTVLPVMLRPGDDGPAVAAMQQRLIELGYWLPRADGEYGGLTTQAVTALQKAAGLSRDGVFGPKTHAALDRGVRPRVRSTSGHVIEINLARQVLLVVDDGVLRLTLNTSTGSGRTFTHPDGRLDVAVTPRGRFSVTRAVDGWRKSDLGLLWRPRYFNGGIAVHGFASVPPFPASHGCTRVSIQAMNMIWDKDLMPIGTPVWVY